MVVAKFGLGRGRWCSDKVGQPHGYGVWKGIGLGWEEFWQRIQLKVRLGDRVSFWRDRWYGDTSLEQLFPSMFGIAEDSEVMVGAVQTSQG